MPVLYSAKSTIDAEGRDAYRVTKFADGEVESSYLTDGHTCDCPAGVRPTCRHRQMLPIMQRANMINTHWFLDYDHGVICDLNGMAKDMYETVVAPPAGEALQGNLPLDEVTPAIPSQPTTWRRF